MSCHSSKEFVSEHFIIPVQLFFLPRLTSGDARHFHMLKPGLVLLLSKVTAEGGKSFYFSTLVEEYTFSATFSC